MTIDSRWEMVTEFIKIILYTGFVDGGRPQSVFLVSDPGHGKTEMLNRFRGNSNVEYFSDITFQPFIQVLVKANSGGRLTHIIIPEFQKVIGRRKDVAMGFLNIALMAMEEGVGIVATGPSIIDCYGQKMGILAATTLDSLQNNNYLINDLAFDSRAFFIDFQATREEILYVTKQMAKENTSALTPILLEFPDKSCKIDLSEKISLWLEDWINEMENSGVPVYGARSTSRFRHVLKGMAVRDDKRNVLEKHFHELYEYKNLWLDLPNMFGSGKQYQNRFKVSKPED